MLMVGLNTEEQDVMRDELDFYGTEKFGI